MATLTAPPPSIDASKPSSFAPAPSETSLKVKLFAKFIQSVFPGVLTRTLTFAFVPSDASEDTIVAEPLIVIETSLSVEPAFLNAL